MSKPPPALYLSAIAYELGDERRVDELPLPPATRERFLGPNGGLRYHRVSEAGCHVLATRSARATLRSSNLAPEQIDAVIFASNSLVKPDCWQDLGALMRDLGLTRSTPIMVNSGDCCNFQVAARLASALITSGDATNVLLVTVDRVADVCPGQYVAVRTSGVNSDAAASCLFSSAPATGFELSGQFFYTLDTSLMGVAAGTKEDDFIKIATLTRSVFSNFYASTGASRTDIRQLITNTFTLDVLEVFAMAARLPGDKVFMRNVGRTGHCFASDNLINLLDFQQETPLHPGDEVLVMGSGVHQCSVFLARFSEAEANV